MPSLLVAPTGPLTTRPRPCPHPLPTLQLFSWPGSSATVTFVGSGVVTVVLDGTLELLPPSDQPQARLNRRFPQCLFQVRGKLSAGAPAVAF